MGVMLTDNSKTGALMILYHNHRIRKCQKVNQECNLQIINDLKRARFEADNLSLV